MTEDNDIEKLKSLLLEGRLDIDTVGRLVGERSPQEAATLRKRLDAALDDLETANTLAGAFGQPTVVGDVSPLAADDMPSSLEELSATAPRDNLRDTIRDTSYGKLPGNERYILRQRLGRGGAGEVWLAQDEFLRREVALKILLGDPPAAEHTDRIDRFIYEAQTTGRLGHPGVVPVYDVGALPDQRWYYTMQLIEGRDLRQVINKLIAGDDQAQQSYPLPRLLHIFSQVCLTIAFAHDRGIIHRDLKPANILLGTYGEVYVGDWGLAKCIEDSHQRSFEPRPGKRTEEGKLLGTAHYMSPEQVEGKIDQMGPATDVYSLGAILYEMLTLRTPFDAPSMINLLYKVATQQPRPPRQVAPDRNIPEPMSELAVDAMRKDPDERMSAKALARHVEGFVDGVKEQQRRAQRAQLLLERAEQLHERYKTRREELDRRRDILDEALASLTPEVPLTERFKRWNEERELTEMELEAEEIYSKTVQFTRQSLEYERLPEARQLLADLFWYKFSEARHDRDEVGALYFRSLVEQYDNGKYKRELADNAEMHIRVDPPHAQVRLESQVTVGPVLTAMEVGFEPGRCTVPAGSYVLHVSAADRQPAQFPILLDSSQATELEIRLPEALGTDEFVYIAGGSYTIGGDDLAPRSHPEHQVDVEPFYMGRYPITLAQYCEFLNALAQTDFDKARSHSPRSPDSGTYWMEIDEERGLFSAPAADEDGDTWSEQWPALMVNWHDANAYCQWRSERDDCTYRLPTEFEWEVAARGPDRRFFPWGDGFDPTLCRMVDSIQGKPIPAAVGSYQLDQSPFGVRDMAGLVVEWTATRDDQDSETPRYIQRGGGFASPASWCRAASRRSNVADRIVSLFGFRIVRDV